MVLSYQGRFPHNPKDEGSNPSPTTILIRPYCSFIVAHNQLALSNFQVAALLLSLDRRAAIVRDTD